MRPKLFVESDTDADSIRTEYTTEEDADALYDIEKILDYNEQLDKYLIKWTGYPVSEATWEPREGLPEDSSEIWTQWHDHLEAVKQGKEKAFDRPEWDRLWQKYRAEKNQRRARRNAKRRKKNLSTRPDTLESEEEQRLVAEGSEEDGEASENEPIAPKVTLPIEAKRLAPRKGVARKLNRVRQLATAHAISSDDSSDSSSEDSGDSLMDELKARKRRRMAPTVQTWRVKERKQSQNVTAGPSEARRRASVPAGKAPQISAESTTLASPGRRRSAQSAERSTHSSTARKSTTVDSDQSVRAARAKKSKNVMANWDAETKKRKRVPEPAALSNDGSRPRFQNLATQNAVQKYSRTEAAPDRSALDIIDPKTGKIIVPSKPKAESRAIQAISLREITVHSEDRAQRGSGSVPSAYARRTPPPVAASNENSSSRYGTEDVLDQSKTTRPDAPAPSAQGWQSQYRQTCRDWLEGNCRFGPQDCHFAHFHPPGDETKMSGEAADKLRLPPREWPYRSDGLYCWFFRVHGKCTQEQSCKFAHRDTGYDAPPPKVTLEDARACQEAYRRRSKIPAGAPEVVEPSTDSAMPLRGPAIPFEPMSTDPEKVRMVHTNVTLPPGKLTCYFWRTRGSCTKNEHCTYAHWDTGLDAAAPGSLRRKPGAVVSITNIPATVMNANLESVSEHGLAANSPTTTFSSSIHRPHLIRSHTDDLAHVRATLVHTPALPEAVASPREVVASPLAITHGVEQSNPPESSHPWIASGSSPLQGTRSAWLRLYHAGDEAPISVRLKLLVLPERSFDLMFGSDPVLQVEFALLVHDVQSLLSTEIESSREVAAGFVHLDVPEEHELCGLTEICKLNECGLLATVPNYPSVMLIYPSMADTWKFLNTSDLPVTNTASLRFRAFSGYSSIQARQQSADRTAKIDPSPAVAIAGRELIRIDWQQIRGKGLAAAFLMIPSSRNALAEAYRQVLSAMKCKVYSSEMPGAWDYFRKKYNNKNGAVLLLHADIPVWQVPGLHDFAAQGGSIFEIGSDDADATSQVECSRVLALGNAVFLTDDLLVYHPETATLIIQRFLDSNRHKPEGGEHNRIVARPGLKQFVLKLITSSTQQDTRYLRLYGAICDLCPQEDEDSEDPPNPLPAANLVSIDPELLPSFDGLWERDEATATDLLVEWFAGWALLNMDKFRRFVVCHLPRDSPHKTVTNGDANGNDNMEVDTRGWSKKYQHIGVLSPDRVLGRVMRAPRPPKGGPDVTRWAN